MADEYENLISENSAFGDLVLLEDEEGNEIEFEMLDMIDYRGKKYAALLPTDEEFNSEVIFMQYEGVEGGTENLITVESLKTIKALFEIFKEHYKDVFDFDDGNEKLN